MFPLSSVATLPLLINLQGNAVPHGLWLWLPLFNLQGGDPIFQKAFLAPTKDQRENNQSE